MTVMYKKSIVQKVGGCKAMTRSEDYDLYVRILHKGYCCKNINDDLVFARIKESKADRRTSKATYRGFVKTRWTALRLGFSSLWDFLVACVHRHLFPFSSLPAKIDLQENSAQTCWEFRRTTPIVSDRNGAAGYRTLTRRGQYLKKSKKLPQMRRRQGQWQYKLKNLPHIKSFCLKLLKDFDSVCQKHHISYQLFAGTALGAVRHHGLFRGTMMWMSF